MIAAGLSALASAGFWVLGKAAAALGVVAAKAAVPVAKAVAVWAVHHPFVTYAVVDLAWDVSEEIAPVIGGLLRGAVDRGQVEAVHPEQVRRAPAPFRLPADCYLLY